MKWKALNIVGGKFFVSAMIALYIWPLLVDLDKKLGIDPWKLKISIIGAIGFAIFFSAVKYSCPTIIAQNISRKKYIGECLDNASNIYDDFEFIKLAGEANTIKLLGDNSYLYPPEKGLYFSKIETVSSYAKINYDYFNCIEPRLRVLLTILFTISVVSIYTPSIIRVISSLR